MTLGSMVSLMQHDNLSNDDDFDEVLSNSGFMDDEHVVDMSMDSRYIQHIVDGLWNSVSDHTFHYYTTHHSMFNLVFDRLTNINHLLNMPRSIDQIRLICQFVVTTYDHERIQELIYFILQ